MPRPLPRVIVALVAVLAMATLVHAQDASTYPDRPIRVIVSVPVFSSTPTADSKRLFDLGANYVQLGHVIGGIAADVLDGRDPATIPVDNLMPVMLHINRKALAGLRDHWTIPEAVAQRADIAVDDAGRHEKQTSGGESNAASR